MAHVRDYYKGGFRAVIGGVPVRLARKPSANALKLMREPPDYNQPDGYCPFTGRPTFGSRACECGHCAGSAIVLPSRDLKRLKRAVRLELRG